MKFSFLHAADLHLGSPLIGLAAKDAEIARQFAAASRRAFSELVTYAIEQRIAFVVIAGDIYDGEWKDASIGLFFNRELSKLYRAGIKVLILKGNHDAASIVTKTIALPESVHVFPTGKPATFFIEDYRVALHGRSFPNREVNENYVEAYPDPVAGWFNIGVLHTSCDGRPPHARYAPCSLDDMRRRGYDYWALGHVHAHEILCEDPKIVFAGNLQGRSIRECGPKGAVRVDVEDQAIKSVTHIPFDQARFGRLTLDLGSVEEEADLLRLVETQLAPLAAEAEKRLLAVRVELQGETGLHRVLKAEAQRLSIDIQAAAQHVGETIWLEKLVIATHEPASVTGHAVLSDLDLAGLFEACERDPELRGEIEQVIRDIGRKLPRGCADQEENLFGEIDALIEDARALTLGRAVR